MTRERLINETDLCMVNVSQIVEGSSDPDFVWMFLADVQMLPAADDGLLELAHHLQRVPQVPGGFGLAQSVAHGSGQSQIVFVKLEKMKWNETFKLV